MTKDSLEAFGPSTAIGRAGQPVEVATAFVFLASADSSYFTAQVRSRSRALASYPEVAGAKRCGLGLWGCVRGGWRDSWDGGLGMACRGAPRSALSRARR